MADLPACRVGHHARTNCLVSGHFPESEFVSFDQQRAQSRHSGQVEAFTMSRPLRLPHPQTTLHLYRHLLRESSYLPWLVRKQVDIQIKERFRKHQKDDVNHELTKKRIKDAHKELRRMRAANAGDMPRMRRIMLLAFGRTGRRRRQLVKELLAPEIATTNEELEKHMAETATIMKENRKVDWLDKWDTEKLGKYARMQASVSLHDVPKPELSAKQINPALFIPKENSWGKPLTPQLYRTKLKKMWKLAADKIMPPLPKEEFEMLGALAQGKIRDPKLLLPPPRRPVAQPLDGEIFPPRTWNWQDYAVKPVAIVEKAANRRNKLLTGAVDEHSPVFDPQPLSCHKYTMRSWRRLYQSIWQLCSTIEKGDDKSFKVVWGSPDFMPPRPSMGELEFFRDFPVPEKQSKKQRRAQPQPMPQ